MKIRVGSRELEKLQFIVRRGYILIPGERGGDYRTLDEKGLIEMTVSRSHKTLKSGVTIVDIWRIEPTPLGLSVAGEQE